MSDRFSIDGMEELFREDMLRFIARLRELLRRLKEYPEDVTTAQEVRAIGHSMKGTTSLVGIVHLSRCGAVIERLAEIASGLSSSDRERSHAIYEGLERTLGWIEQLLEACLKRESRAARTELFQRVVAEIPEEFRQKLAAEDPEILSAEVEEGETDATAAEAGAAGDGQAEGTSASDEEAFAEELAEVFALELQEHLEKVPAELPLLSSPATRPSACHRLNRVFHTIKGSAAMVGLQELSEAAKRLEHYFARPEGLFERAEEAQEDIERVFGAAELTPPDLVEALAAVEAAAVGREELDQELLAAFSVDAREALEQCEHLLLRLERRPGDRDTLQALFRQFHTLKGAAGAVGLEQIATYVHEAESLLEEILEGQVRPDWGRLVDFLFRLTDHTTSLIDEALGLPASRPAAKIADIAAEIAALKEAVPAPLVEGPAEPVPEPTAPTAPAEAEAGVVRVQASRLDALLNQVGQLVFSRTRMEQKIAEFGDFQDKLNAARSRLVETIEGFQRRFEYTIGETPSLPRPVEELAAYEARPGGGDGGEATSYGSGVDDFFTDLEFDKYDDFNILARSVIELATDMGEIADQLGRYIDSLGEETRQFAKITSGLQRQITTLRLVPLDTVFRRLVRPVRDAARQEGKLVDLQIQGGDVQVDRAVAEALYAPLLHLVRNAVSHGIEVPAVREARGKGRMGAVRITAEAQYNSVVLTVEDDGAGIDYDAVLAKGREMKLIDPENPPKREDLLSLIFRPGFSTGASVTDLAGRGVGMDVVARQVAALNGSVLVESHEGTGTTFRLSLPITTSIEEVLVLEVAEQLFALPISFVERSVLIDPEVVPSLTSAGRLPVGDEDLPILMMGPLMGKPVPAEGAVGIVLRAGERAMVVVVDRVLAQQEVVIRPLNPVLTGHPFISGGTISGAGEVIFILQVGRLFDLLARLSEEPGWAEPFAPAAAVEEAPHGILVVDDSISVRKLATRFLESEGLEVETAVDGIDALDKLSQHPFRVVVTDLEMPRMHGYDLVAAIKSNPRWAQIPVIVCTSRASEKHRRRAQDVGADGYVTKPFSKEEIIAAIRRVTEWAELGEDEPHEGSGARDE